jgi:hypothetical protein
VPRALQQRRGVERVRQAGHAQERASRRGPLAVRRIHVAQEGLHAGAGKGAEGLRQRERRGGRRRRKAGHVVAERVARVREEVRVLGEGEAAPAVADKQNVDVGERQHRGGHVRRAVDDDARRRRLRRCGRGLAADRRLLLLALGVPLLALHRCALSMRHAMN